MVSRPADPPDETHIRRYMDLAKFASLAFSRKLWLPKLAELWRADPWEGFGRAKGLKRPSRMLSKNVSLELEPAQVLYAEFSGLHGMDTAFEKMISTIDFRPHPEAPAC